MIFVINISHVLLHRRLHVNRSLILEYKLTQQPISKRLLSAKVIKLLIIE
jgi:hypothetical protein